MPSNGLKWGGLWVKVGAESSDVTQKTTLSPVVAAAQSKVLKWDEEILIPQIHGRKRGIHLAPIVTAIDPNQISTPQEQISPVRKSKVKKLVPVVFPRYEEKNYAQELETRRKEENRTKEIRDRENIDSETALYKDHVRRLVSVVQGVGSSHLTFISEQFPTTYHLPLEIETPPLSIAAQEPIISLVRTKTPVKKALIDKSSSFKASAETEDEERDQKFLAELKSIDADHMLQVNTFMSSRRKNGTAKKNWRTCNFLPVGAENVGHASYF